MANQRFHEFFHASISMTSSSKFNCTELLSQVTVFSPPWDCRPDHDRCLCRCSRYELDFRGVLPGTFNSIKGRAFVDRIWVIFNASSLPLSRCHKNKHQDIQWPFHCSKWIAKCVRFLSRLLLRQNLKTTSWLRVSHLAQHPGIFVYLRWSNGWVEMLEILVHKHKSNDDWKTESKKNSLETWHPNSPGISHSLLVSWCGQHGRTRTSSIGCFLVQILENFSAVCHDVTTWCAFTSIRFLCPH